MTERTLPVRDATSEPFWQAARSRELWLQKCPVTGRHQWYPRAHSIHAPAVGVAPEWVRASGFGRVFTFSVIHRGNGPKRPPYAVAVIELDEGVLFTASLKEVTLDDIVIGMAVEVDFEVVDDATTLPFFKPRRTS